MKKVLLPFQEVGARFMASGFHRANGDDPGLGKTVQAIRAADLVNATSGLVTCPASVRTNWWEHLEEHYGHTRGWDVISYDGARIDSHRAHLRDRYGVWIGDEVHFCKTCDSLRTRAIFGRDGLARRADYKWPLSGTMAPNGRPVELYPMLKSLAPAFAGMSFTKYTQLYCGAYFDGYGWNVKGATRVDELAAILRDFMIRRTKREVFPDRKEPIVSRVGLDLAPGALAAVTAEEDAIGGREARLSSVHEKFSQLGDTSKLLRLLGEAKTPAIGDFVEDLLESHEKVVVFFQHTSVGEALRQRFARAGLGPVVYQGGMNDSGKDQVKRQFMQDRATRVFLGQRQAAGTGINGLQTVCSAAVIAEPGWAPGDTEQLIDRLDRIGLADDLVNAYILYARGTLDAVVVRVHDVKEYVGDRLMSDEIRAALGILGDMA